MNKKTLLEFIQRIYESSSITKARFSLGELKEILVQQQASQELITLVEKAITSVPEGKNDLVHGDLTEQSLEIAYTRAKARIAREEAARAYGRC